MTYLYALRTRLVPCAKLIGISLIVFSNPMCLSNVSANPAASINTKVHKSLCDLINSRSLYDFNSSSTAVAKQIKHQSHIVKTNSFDRRYQMQQQKQKEINQRLQLINQQLSKIEISQ